MIEAKNLFKEFKTYQKPPGFLGSLKSLFLREYQTNQAVSPFNLSVEKGEIVGLLGPNGAGKTTLMKMFSGIIVPSGGTLSVVGYQPYHRQRLFRKKIALVMGQKSQLWWDLPAMDSFQLLQRYYEIEEKTFRNRLNELAEVLDVNHVLKIHVRKLSLGERMKVELMASLLHRPEIIFLDEPTIGLDLIAQRNIRNFIREYHAKTKTTIILTSHYMADVEALCSRIVLLLKGAKRYDGPKSDFEKLLGHEKSVSFTFATSVKNKMAPIWEKYDAKWNMEGTQVDLRIPEEELREAGRQVLENYEVIDFSTEKMPIERVMNTIMEKPELVA